MADEPDDKVSITLTRSTLQRAIEVFDRGGSTYIGWINTLPPADAYAVALLVGFLLAADQHGRFQA